MRLHGGEAMTMMSLLSCGRSTTARSVAETETIETYL